MSRTLTCLDLLHQPVLQFLEGVDVPTAVLDEADVFVWVSPAWCKAFGVKPEEWAVASRIGRGDRTACVATDLGSQLELIEHFRRSQWKGVSAP